MNQIPQLLKTGHLVPGALYQLHLVKAETVRPLIPREFKLVEAFGYTLGGFFLASYDDSPVGTFDELVVIAGIVWNPPTSCAWASRVLVNSDEACAHGRKDVGLPSHVARFSKSIKAVPKKPKGKISSFLNTIGLGTNFCGPKNFVNVQVTEERPASLGICSIDIATVVPELQVDKWMGPSIKMSLPSFSGHTKYNSNLLKYACQIKCRVRAVQPAEVSRSTPEQECNNRGPSCKCQNPGFQDSLNGEHIDDGQDISISVLLSKPILALKFTRLQMRVEAPTLNASGNGRPSKKALNRPSDLPGCENGASWDAPLMVANDKISPWT
ncbi:hypothetical protein RJ641_012973 [Dillenia turbinata]|uniref:Protein NEOXANTHIN-DEFICIENT 1 n=1 Tax=Dillenia turbinata TaxID=194707 RepID=A0AAN8V364_9MAGN